MKKKEIFIALELVFIISIVLFAFYNTKDFGMVGFATYESQPGAEEGKDTYIREEIDSNYGDSTTLKIGKTSGDVELRSILEFNLSEIPESHTVSDAKISLKSIYASEDEPITVNIYRITQNWTKTGATWYNKTDTDLWDKEGGDYDSEIIETIEVTNETKWFNISITNLAQSWVNNSYENHGVILIPKYDTETGNYRDFGSSEREGEEPKIIIEHSENTPPFIENVTTNSAPDNPKKPEEDLKFSTEWYDLEDDAAKTYICNSSNISEEGCEEKQFCFINYTQESPKSCSYTITGEEDWETDYWVRLCDDYGCSDIFNNSFYVHQEPSVLLIDPIGNETINQSEGNYTINFNVTDPGNYDLKSNLYYGEEQNSTANEIATDLNTSEFCSNAGGEKECSYSWNTSGIYGDYYLTVEINDSYSLVYDTSNSSFSVVSLIDPFPPNITDQWKEEENITSGEEVTFYADVYDENLEDVWISINSTNQINTTMQNITEETFKASWIAENIGNYSFKVYADDKVGNINDTMPWIDFEVYKPDTTTQNEKLPPTSLPYHTVKVEGELNSSGNPLKEVDAYLNVPDGFSFLEDYPQNFHLGNFSSNETKKAEWYVSTPLEEGTYNLNITYTDKYGNSWNSSDMEIEVTSEIGDYELNLEGYSYVMGGNEYSAETTFKKSNTYTSADSMEISIYDAAGNLIVDSASINEEETGNYNYTYNVPSSAVEGQWETRANATKDSESYYKNHFWRVVGGPFDVRDIQIVDSTINELEISAETENTGDVDKDLHLEWTLEEESTEEELDSGADTFMVEANSEKTWTVYPETDFVGNARITFVGTDVSSGEKAGSYKTFDTKESDEDSPPSDGGGGGGGAPTTEEPEPEEEKEEINVSFDSIINIGKDTEETKYFTINNTGTKEITDINLKIHGLKEQFYEVKDSINSLKPGETGRFEITFKGESISTNNFNYGFKSKQINKTYSAQLVVTGIKEYLLEQINSLEEKYQKLKDKLEKAEEDELLSDLKHCKNTLEMARVNLENEEIEKTKENIDDSEACINKIKNRFETEEPEEKFNEERIFWIIVLVILVVLLLTVIFLIYIVYRKFSLISFLKKEGNNKKPKKTKNIDMDKKIGDIENKLKE